MSASPFDFIDDEELDDNKSLDTTELALNILSVLMLVATVVTAFVFMGIFVNPQSGFNPFPPPTMPVLVIPDTLTPTPKNVLPPTWTPLPSNTPLPTDTPEPTDTPGPTDTPTPTETQPPTATIEPSPTVKAEQSFQLQEGSPVALPNFAHADAGCGWFGVAGHIYDLAAEPITNSSVVIEIGGFLEGEEISQITLSGMSSGVPYGEGGFEIVLGDHPVTTSGELWIQLKTPSADLALSERIFFDTFEDCEKNLIVIDFVQVE